MTQQTSISSIYQNVVDKLYGMVVIDPASTDGDYGCAIRYKLNKKGQIVVKSIKYKDAQL